MTESCCIDCLHCKPYKDTFWCSISQIVVEQDFYCDYFEPIDL